MASTSWKYQMTICDAAWMWTGFMMSGINPSGCFKACNGWCRDTSSPYFRMDGDDAGSYNGVAFNENGHQNVANKLVSVGLRRHRPFLPDLTNTPDSPGASCKSLRQSGYDVDGYYWVDPNGGSASDSFVAYCDMTTDGGGWTLCYSDDTEVHMKTETTFSVGKPVGMDGYRTDCRNIPFGEVLYVNEGNGQKAWFSRDSAGTITAGSTNWFVPGATYGLWTTHGVAPTSSKYQLMICDNGWMWTGLMISGYTSCYKACNSWCSDGTSAWFRMDGDDGASYNGVCFNENGHRNASTKLMSVGIR